MPEQKTIRRARADARAGKSASTQAGEFVKAEIDKVRAGKHGARSAKQAIAIGLSEARRSGVRLKAPAKSKSSAPVRTRAARDLKKGQRPSKPDPKRSRASLKALRKEPAGTVSKAALSKQTKSVARTRSAASRSLSAKKAAATRTRSAKAFR